MSKQHISMRLESSTIEAVEAWASSHGTTRTAAIEALLLSGLDGPAEGREKPQEAAGGQGGTEAHADDLRAVCEVLRASNADLRAEVSRLWAQLSEKDAQIRSAQNIADHAQQLHAAEVTRALPEEGEQTRTLRQRLAAIFGKGASR